MAKKPAEAVDAAWRDIRRHLDRAPDAPLLVYAFAEDSEPVREIARRVRVALRARGTPVRHVVPESPDDLRGVLTTLFDEAGAVVIVDAPRADRDGRSEWADAWATVIARLNAGREQVRADLKGLILAMPLAFRGRAHATGPDLWSVHDVVCELGAAETRGGMSVRFDADPQRPPAPPPDVALAAAEAIEAREGRTEGWARTLIDALPGLVERGEAARALRLGRGALAVLPREDARWPELLAGVAAAEAATGDVGAAVAHWEEAAGATDELHAGAVWWLIEAGRVLRTSFLHQDAVQVLRAAVKRGRARSAALPAQSTRRDLAAALDQLGRAYVESGLLKEGAGVQGEALALARKNLANRPNDAGAREDVCMSMLAWADCLEDSGQLSDARDLYEAALAEARYLGSEATAGLRLLPTALQAYGRLALREGRLPEAERALEEARELLQPHVSLLRSPDWERREHLAACSELLARVYQERRDYVRSLASFDRAVELTRSLLGHGSDPQALDDLAVCLNNLGVCASKFGDRARSLAAAREALDVRRRMARLLDDAPHALGDLIVSLGNLALDAPADAVALVAEARAVLARIPVDAIPAEERRELTDWLSKIPH